ncbi:MAG: RtcB family protein [Deltaproteobacteria bacterium]|nr:RtcB family protein [Deltaproteobacteria bacterium]
MSFKYAAERVSANHYVLARRGDMRCDVHAYLSGPLYEATDEALWRQAATSAATPGAIGMYLMPDCHIGYGIPVGGVLVTEDTIVQAGSGYDISCGVVHLEVPGLSAADVADKQVRRRWIQAVEARVATGLGSHRPALAPRVDTRKLPDVLRYGAKAIGVPADVCERQYIPVADDVDPTSIQRAFSVAAAQLGSVGGGNHFIELQVDRDDGSVWIMVHCGSRGYGWQTANHFFYEGAKLRGLPKGRREESWLSVREPLGRRYWAHHNAAANYAVANRHTLVGGVREATREVLGADARVYYEISHNLVQEETLVLPDGKTKRGFVHRKGATRAFPAGHPELAGTRWAETGHPCLVPGSMLHGAAILFPEAGAYRSACSVNHGSGRHLGRGEAKRELAPRHGQIDHEMRSVTRAFGPDQVPIVGVVGNTERTPLDECGHVYKDLDQVLAVLEAEGIARVHRRLYPVANIKGTD